MIIKKASLSFDEELTPLTRVDKIILHHSEEPLDVHGMHELHKQTYGLSGIGYNYYIEQNGEIYEGRGMNIGSHTKGHNSKSVGICLAGNFESGPPATAQIESAVTLVSNIAHHHELQVKSIVGHNEIDNSHACPGLFFDLDVFRDKVRRLEG
jgi:N-acetylmuramoyl-L-alanine amidase